MMPHLAIQLNPKPVSLRFMKMFGASFILFIFVRPIAHNGRREAKANLKESNCETQIKFVGMNQMNEDFLNMF